MEGTRYRFLLPKLFSLGTRIAVDAACWDWGMSCVVSTDAELALDIAQLSMSDSSINLIFRACYSCYYFLMRNLESDCETGLAQMGPAGPLATAMYIASQTLQSN